MSGILSRLMVISFCNMLFFVRYKRAWFKQATSKYTWQRKLNFHLNLKTLIDQYCHHYVIEHEYYNLTQFLYYRLKSSNSKNISEWYSPGNWCTLKFIKIFYVIWWWENIKHIGGSFWRNFLKVLLYVHYMFFCKHI